MLRTFKSRLLAEFWRKGSASKIDTRLQARILVRPGFDFHALRGPKPKRYTVHVNGPFCITFGFEDGDAFDIDFEQYHCWESPMTTYPAIHNPARCPTHPGALLRDEVIPATGKTKTNIARMLGISRQHLYDILEERKPVSAEVAVRLGKLFGNDGGLYYRMQAAHDLWKASRNVDVSAIPTLSAA